MKIYFKEDTHQYFSEEHEQYISVSGLAKLLEKEVDWAAKLKKKAKELGISPKELQAEWDNKKLLGTQAGTKVHKRSELKRLSSPKAIIKGVECGIVHADFYGGFKWSASSPKLENNTLYPELMISDHEHKVCGQSDEVSVVNNAIWVYDIKTDKSIERTGYSSEWKGPEKFKAPVSHLDKCSFNMYSIKMSLYMHMIWKENKHLKVGGLLLDWQPILRDEDGIPILDDSGEPTVLRSEIIKVPYLRREVKDILAYYKAGKLK